MLMKKPMSSLSRCRPVRQTTRLQLRQSKLQERLSSVAAAVPGFLFTIRVEVDGHTSFPYASAGVEKLFGLRPEEIRADAATLRARYHPDDRARLLQLMTETARTLGPFRIEIRIEHPERGQRWVEIRSTPQRQADGATEWHGLMIDISERKAMEECLVAREEQFRSLAENSPDPIYRYGPDCRRLYVNRAVDRIFGTPVAQLIGCPPSDGALLGTRQSGKLMEAIRGVFASGVANQINLDCVDREQLRRDYNVLLVPEPGPDGQVATVLAIARDLTAIREAERRMAHFVANVKGFVYTLRRSPGGHFRFAFASPGIVDIFGLQPEDVESDMAPLHALLHPADRPGVEAALAETAVTLSALELVFRVCRPGLPERWVEARSTPLRESDSSTVWHGFLYDVTERKQNERALEESRNRLSSVMTTLPDYIWLKNADGVYVACNPAFERYFNAREADIVGKTDYDFVDAELADSFREKDRQAVEAGGICIYEEWGSVAEDERRVLLETRKVAVRGAGGEVVGVLGISRDITERKRREDELGLLNYAIDHIEEAVYLLDDAGRITYANQHACRGLGYSKEELRSLSVADIDPDCQQGFWSEHWRELQARGSLTLERRHRTRDGRIFPIEIVANYLESDGRGYNMAMIRNITERKRMEALLLTREQEFRTLAENSPDTIARYDRDCRRLYANRKLITQMEKGRGQILGTTPIEYPGGTHAQEYMDKMRAVFEQGEPRDFELHWQVEGVGHCSHVRLSPEFDDAGEVARVLAVGRDITEIDQYRKKVRHLAFYDSLTKLPNRALLFDRIRLEIAHAQRYRDQMGLMILDLDRFKQVNDTLGHGAGDRLLCEVAQRLKHAVRTADTIARLGGDEFGVLLPEVHGKGDLKTVAGNILQALAEPFHIEGRELFVSCSIGVVLFPDDGVEMEALLRYADTAMYFAKKKGRNNFQFYAREMGEQFSEKMELESALRKACDKGELALHYQPQIDLPSGRVVGAEALLRWNRPGHGLVPPDRFIPIAEESGLIVEIGEWVLATACAEAAALNRQLEAVSATPVRMAVNVSTRQFLRNDLVGAVRRILAGSGCRAEWLKLEITEGLLLEDSPEVADMLAELDGMGVSISIDDFGTGYSALSYLHRFPVAQIKIDKSFVQGIPYGRRQCELVKAMLSIAAALQLEVVAEGVETRAQADYLSAHGCQLVQGYFFGKPVPLLAFEAMLAVAEAAQ